MEKKVITETKAMWQNMKAQLNKLAAEVYEPNSGDMDEIKEAYYTIDYLCNLALGDDKGHTQAVHQQPAENANLSKAQEAILHYLSNETSYTNLCEDGMKASTALVQAFDMIDQHGSELRMYVDLSGVSNAFYNYQNILALLKPYSTYLRQHSEAKQ